MMFHKMGCRSVTRNEDTPREHLVQKLERALAIADVYNNSFDGLTIAELSGEFLREYKSTFQDVIDEAAREHLNHLKRRPENE